MTSARQLALSLPPLQRDPAATFIPGPANAAARATLAAWETWPGRAMALIGPEGCGKTHLAQLWARETGASWVTPGVRGAFSATMVIDEADVGLDDGFGYQLFERLRSGEVRAALFAARQRPDEWPTTTPDVASRYAALTTVNVAAPSDEELRAVLVKLLADRALDVDAEAVEFVVRRIERSFAGAAAAAAALDTRAMELKRRVTRHLAQELWNDDVDWDDTAEDAEDDPVKHDSGGDTGGLF